MRQRLDDHRCANGAAELLRSGADEVSVEPTHETQLEGDAGTFGGGADLLALEQVHRHRLLEVDVQPCLYRYQGECVVRKGRCRDDNAVIGSALKRLLQRGAHQPDAVVGGKLLGLSLIHISEPTRLGMISYA